MEVSSVFVQFDIQICDSSLVLLFSFQNSGKFVLGYIKLSLALLVLLPLNSDGFVNLLLDNKVDPLDLVCGGIDLVLVVISLLEIKGTLPQQPLMKSSSHVGASPEAQGLMPA